jgi:hypothetical protein
MADVYFGFILKPFVREEEKLSIAILPSRFLCSFFADLVEDTGNLIGTWT